MRRSQVSDRWQWEGGKWSPWHRFETPGAVVDVAAVSQRDELYQCVITDTGGRLWYARFDGDTYWSSWTAFDQLPLPER